MLCEGAGIFCFPLRHCLLMLLKLLREELQFADALVSFGELAVELVQCGSMLSISVTELDFQPMDPSLGRFEFLHACVEPIVFRTGSFHLGDAALKVYAVLARSTGLSVERPCIGVGVV